MNSVGYKIKKTILYILLILLGAACLFPFLLMVVPKRRRHHDIVYPDPWGSAGEQLEDGI